ncbi:MAG: hypothetical protein AAF378_16075 [Cyanobacteria bacterium P01_A01_bin.84]
MRTAISLMITGLVFSSLNVIFDTSIDKLGSQLLSAPKQLQTSIRRDKKNPTHRGSGRREMLEILFRDNYEV